MHVALGPGLWHDHVAFNVCETISRDLSIPKDGGLVRKQTKVKDVKVSSFVSFQLERVAVT